MLIYIFIILLFASLVILHEWGHFFAARRGGVKVEEFGIGFPPKAWGKVVGGTLYTLNWLPLGGFVRMKGEDGDDKDKDAFGSAKIGIKTKILLAGVVMNFLTAIVILYVLAITGIPGLGDYEPKFLHSTYAQARQLVITDVVENSPAGKAGIRRGDLILRAGDEQPQTEEALRNFTQAHAGQLETFVLKTAGQAEHSVRVQLKPAGSKDGFLGVGSQQVYKLKYDPASALVAAVWMAGGLFWATIVGIFSLLLGIPMLIIGLFQPAVPAAAAQASGPLGIIFIFQSASALGLAYVFLFLANIAVALAAFNVLPLPALDGGRLALIWWQHVTGRKLSVETEAKIHGYGFLALIGLMLIITVYDVRRRFF